MKSPIMLKQDMELIAVTSAPAVTLILPFDPKMSSRSEVEYRLKMAIGKAERELILNYTAEKAMPLIGKLQLITKGLNYNTHKKSIAIFLSQDLEKLFYLDIPVEERIVIDESFEIRDLIYSKKQMKMYLILILSSRSCKTYLGNDSEFTLIKSNVPQNSESYKRDLPEKAIHFCDPQQQKELQMDNFLKHMDDGLSLILHAYPFPVFVLGTERVVGHFRKITHNSKHLVGYIHGNYEDESESVIRDAMKNYLADWKNVKQTAMLQELDAAAGERKLAGGLENCWEASRHRNGRLLIVEKGFHSPLQSDNQGKTIHGQGPKQAVLHSRDAVDEVMEKVLESGGDIEFVDDGLLEKYGRIALVKYY